MSAVVITAQILGHVRKAAEDDNGGCTFIFDSSSEYIEYKIKVHAPQLPYEPIVVRRRYTDFLKLHADLKEREGKVPLSPGGGSGGGAGAADEFMLPSKKLLSISRNPFKNFNNRLDDEFVEERMRKLQSYLDTALRAPLSSEMLVDWEEPLTNFLSVGRLLAPTGPGGGRGDDDGGGMGQEGRMGAPGGARGQGAGGGGGNPFGGGGGRRPAPPPPPPPPFAKVKSEAALRLTRVARGRLGRQQAWQALLKTARPLYVSVTHVSGYALAANKASSYVSGLSASYSPYLLVSAHDKSTGRQLCAARSLTGATTATTDWEWDGGELLCLPSVLPDCTLVVTVLDSCSIGRDNLLAQAACELTQSMAKIFTLYPKNGSSSGGGDPASSSSSAAAASSSALISPSTSGLSRTRGRSSPDPPPGSGSGGKSSLWGGHSALPAFSPPPPPPPPSQLSAASSSLRNSRLSASDDGGGGGLRNSVAGGGGIGGASGGAGPLRPVNALDLKLGSDQKFDVWHTGSPSTEAFEAFSKAKAEAAERAAEAAAAAADTGGGDGLGGSNHGVSSYFSRSVSTAGGDGLGGSNHGGGARSYFGGGRSVSVAAAGDGLGGSSHGTRSYFGSLSGGLGGSNHGAPSSPSSSDDAAAPPPMAVAAPPASFDKARVWEFGEISAAVRWCPLRACKVGPMYRLVLPVGIGLGLRKASWAKCFVVLTREELLVYSNEGDAKPLKKMRVGLVEKVTASSCSVVAERVEAPEGVDPWDSVITVHVDQQQALAVAAAASSSGGSGAAGAEAAAAASGGPWHLLVPNGMAGQRQWKRLLNDAIFHAQSGCADDATSQAPHGGGGDQRAAGFDLSFLPPSRPRLPTLESNRSASITRDTLDLPNGGGSFSGLGGGDSDNEGALLRPRSSSTGSIADVGPGPLPPSPEKSSSSNNPFGMRDSIVGAFRESGL